MYLFYFIFVVSRPERADEDAWALAIAGSLHITGAIRHSS